MYFLGYNYMGRGEWRLGCDAFTLTKAELWIQFSALKSINQRSNVGKKRNDLVIELYECEQKLFWTDR